jgi:indole-3-glycerol phosphate synthase
MSTVLEKICADKLGHIARMKAQTSLAELEGQIKSQAPTRGFIQSLLTPETAIIAEVKKASPSKGIIRADFDPVDIAQTYEKNGAACLSVLTDEPYFQGCDDYLRAIRTQVSLPILRKDFMLDAYQVFEARAMGADCILLIMAALTDQQAKELYDTANALSLDTLFEVHDEEELERALALSPKMVGVNNRNLKTLDVSLETGLGLGQLMPHDIVKVAESGLNTHDDIQRFKSAGFNAFLIGESMMKQPDIGAALQKILSRD